MTNYYILFAGTSYKDSKGQLYDILECSGFSKSKDLELIYCQAESLEEAIKKLNVSKVETSK